MAACKAWKEAVCNDSYEEKAEATRKKEVRKVATCSSSWPTFSWRFLLSRNSIFGWEPLKPVPAIRTKLEKDMYSLETIILTSPMLSWSVNHQNSVNVSKSSVIQLLWLQNLPKLGLLQGCIYCHNPYCNEALTCGKSFPPQPLPNSLAPVWLQFSISTARKLIHLQNRQ